MKDEKMKEIRSKVAKCWKMSETNVKKRVKSMSTTSRRGSLGPCEYRESLNIIEDRSKNSESAHQTSRPTLAQVQVGEVLKGQLGLGQATIKG